MILLTLQPFAALIGVMLCIAVLVGVLAIVRTGRKP